MDEKNDIKLFEYDDDEGEFHELELSEDVLLYDLLDPEVILLFREGKFKRFWLWIGKVSNAKMRFKAIKAAEIVRDSLNFGFVIKTEDDGTESLEFKIFIGLVKREERKTQNKGSIYKETEQDNYILENLSIEELLSKLENVEQPDGYKRMFVIYGENIYRYREQITHYVGANVKELNLVPLNQDLPDGHYLLEGYLPRIHLFANKVQAVELLKKEGME